MYGNECQLTLSYLYYNTLFFYVQAYFFRNAPSSSLREFRYADPATSILPNPSPPTTKSCGPVFGSSDTAAGATVDEDSAGAVTVDAVDIVDFVSAGAAWFTTTFAVAVAAEELLLLFELFDPVVTTTGLAEGVGVLQL